MKNLYKLLVLAAVAFGGACEDDKTENTDLAPVASVKTGAATVDETEVTLEGSFRYEGTEPVSVGFRYAPTQTGLLTAEIIPAEPVGDEAFLLKISDVPNGEYYYQAVAEVEEQLFAGKTGWFKVDFSATPEVTTEPADISAAGITLKGTYKFDSKKIPIQLGFLYATTREEVETAEFKPAEVDGNTFSLELGGTTNDTYYYQAVAVVQDTQFRGEVRSIRLVDLMADGAANCFIVPEAGWYGFETKKPDGSVVTGAKAAWVWATEKQILSDIRYENGRIVFKATGDPGNETIALTDGDGKIQWSWHIWVTERPQDQTFEGTTMLDRNIGATSADANLAASLGCYFQWGRKDPFVGANVVQTADAYESKAFDCIGPGERVWTARYVFNSDLVKGFTHVGKTMDEATSIADPCTYYGAYNSGGWSGSNAKIGDFWGGVSGSKANYDPCPAGYRVPTDDELATYIMWLMKAGGASVSNPTAGGYGKVIVYNGTTYNFPGSGLRAWSALLRYPGRVTFLWSSTISATEKKAQRFYDFRDARAADAICQGMAVRCIKIK